MRKKSGGGGGRPYSLTARYPFYVYLKFSYLFLGCSKYTCLFVAITTGLRLEQYEAEGYNILPRDAWRNLLVRYEPYDWLLYVVVFDDFYKKVHSYGLRGPKELTDEYLQIQRFCAVWIEGVTHESDASLEAAASSCLMYQEAE